MNFLSQAIKLFANTGTCQPEQSNILTFPNWYRNLKCEDGGAGGVVFQSINDMWIVLANVLDISIRIAVLLALIFIIYGGIRYIMSRGEPENIQTAKKIITNSVIGLVIAVLAATIVGFIAGSFLN